MNTRATHKTDGSPVIGSVSLFVSTLWDAVDMMPKKWQHNFGDALRTSAMVYEKYGAYTQQYVKHGQIVFRMAYKYSEKGICENNRKIYLRNLNRRLRERRKVMFNL